MNSLAGLIFLFNLSAGSIPADAPVTEIVNPDISCQTPGRQLYINQKDQRMWLAVPWEKKGIEPHISKLLNTGTKSLFIEAESDFYGQKVNLLFTLREISGELRANLRIFDSFGEESAILKFRCEDMVLESRRPKVDE